MTNLESFDHNQPIKSQRFLVKDIIPADSLTAFISKEGVGKSFLAEYLAECIIRGSNFMGRKTLLSNVLLIDQDTPDRTLIVRLKALDKGLIKIPKICNLYIEPTKRCYLDDGSLVRAINKCEKAKVIIIDCLHRVCGDLNPNATEDMNVLSKFKEQVIRNGRTVILLHHVSSKSIVGVDEMMSTENIGNLSMGSSAILQQVDTYFVLGSKAKSNLERLYIRPVQRRIPLDIEPFTAKLEDNGNAMKFIFEHTYKKKEIQLCEIDKDIIRVLFSRQELREPSIYVSEMMKEWHGRYWEGTVRESISRLIKIGAIIEIRKTPHRWFKYKLNPDYKIPFKI